MAAMLIVMVIVLFAGAHHGSMGSHDAQAPHAGTAQEQPAPAAKKEKDER